MIEILNTLLSPLENIITKYREVLRWFLLTLSFFALFLIFFPHQQRDTGSQAYDVLFVILFLPIAARVIGLSLAQALMPLRKELGILMGVLAWVHSAIYMLGYSGFLFDPYFWWDNGFVTYLAMGFVALVLITPLLLTSSNLAIKLLGKKWKLLHRTVYFVAIFTVLHVILIQWARRQSIDYGTLALLSGYFLGKILEWKGVSFGPKKTYAKGQKFLCVPCGYIYDPAVGDVEDGIAPGTEFADIPESWRCPVCGVTKADFVPYDEHTPMESYPAKVIKKTLLNPTTIELIIETETVFVSRPGQFMTFLFADSTGEFSRSYSIARVSDKQYTFLIKLVPNGRGSSQLNTLEAGNPVKIRGIFGQFILAHTLAPKIFIATGTGLAPIVNMIRTLPDTIKKSLYFSVSTQADLFYAEELRAIKNLDLHICVSREEVTGCEFGRINIDAVEAPLETEWYLCGNPKMVEENITKLNQRGYTQIHHEVFN